MTSTQVIEIIRYDLPAGRVEEFLDAYAQSLPHLSADPHCLSVEVLRSIDAKTHRVLVRIGWDSVEGHEVAFTEGPHFERFITPLRPWLGYVVEMTHYEQVGL